MVEPPRGYRIIIGCQVTRTLSAGFNWPIIVARIEVGAASVQIGVKLLGWPALCAQAQRQRSADFPTRSFAIVATTSSAGYYATLVARGRFRSFRVCRVYMCVCMYIYTYAVRVQDWIVFARGRVCVRVRERGRESETGIGIESRNGRKLVTAGLFDLRSKLPPPLPSPPPRFSATFHLSSFLCFARRPLLHIYVFLRPIACPVAPSLSLALARRVSICPALATAQPLCRPLALLSSIPIRLARSSTPLAPFRNY